MRTSFFSALVWGFATLLLPATSWGFLDFFEKDYENAPNNAELQSQESAAKALLAEAQSQESGGSSGKAVNTYRKIVQLYPLTTTAALSQYKVGTIYEAQGDYVKAFDAFQMFVENYKGSSAFAAAVESQYNITVAGQNGEFKETFLGIPRKLQPSELLEMYGKVISNAPFSNYAPLAQFQIAEVYQNDGKAREAIAAYQKLVDDYPKSKKAPEAQYRIGAIGVNALENGSQDPAKMEKAKEAYQDLMIQFPDHERATAAQEGISKLTAGDAKKSFEIASFYERKKRYRSARVYYKKVAQVPSSPHYAEAQQKLASMPMNETTDTETLSEPEANSERREFKFPSMPKIPRLFGKKEDDGNYTDGASNLADGDIDGTNWAELDREMQENLGNGRSAPAEVTEDPLNVDVDTEKEGFSMPNIAFWKRSDSGEDSGGTAPSPEISEAIDESDDGGRSGLKRLAFWKKDDADKDLPPSSDFAPVDATKKKTTSSRPTTRSTPAPASVVKISEEEEKKKFPRIPRLPGFGKKDKESDVAAVPAKKVKNLPTYVGPPAPKKKTASVPMRINSASETAQTVSSSNEVKGGKPSEEAKKRLIAPPPPEE